MRSTIQKLLLSSATIAISVFGSAALLSGGCFAQDCTMDVCAGPLNIVIQNELIPDDAHVELVVKGKVLECSTTYAATNQCYIYGNNEGFYIGDVQHYEVKSLPKAITVRIISADGQEIAHYDETPKYTVKNKSSCSTECHKNATVWIGEPETP